MGGEAAGLLWLLVAWTAGGNALVCAAVAGRRPLRSRGSHLLVASLAASDLLVALLVMPWKAAATAAGRWPFGAAFCRLWEACDILCSTASILHLCAIALDRYWAVARPFGYARRMSPRVALAGAGLAWALALLVSFVPVPLGWHRGGPEGADGACDTRLNGAYAVASSLLSFYLPVAVVLVAYGRIYRIARGQLRRISSLERAGERARGAPSAASLRRETRVLRTVALIVGAFVCCWLPFFVLNCLLPFCRRRRPDGAPEPCVSPATFDAFVWLGWANSSLNPLIYASDADFRRGLARLLGCDRRRRRRAPTTPARSAELGGRLLSGPPPDAPRRRAASPEPTDGEPELSLDTAPHGPP